MKKLTDWFMLNAALPFCIAVFKAVAFTFTFKVIGGENTTPLKGKDKNYIYAFWHCGLIAPVVYYRNLGIVSLVSMSKDGEIAARVAESFGFKAARGSTFKGAARSLNELKDLLEKGYDVAMNTDGPRGPAENVANGVLYLSKLTGRRIVPFGVNWNHMVRLTSWDRFMIPLPFAKCVFKFGEPVLVQPDSSGEIIQGQRQLLIAELKKLNKECGEEFVPGK
jgi:lysophospholipid acyltransferase (LPLAT)-like uncharacterized protein